MGRVRGEAIVERSNTIDLVCRCCFEEVSERWDDGAGILKGVAEGTTVDVAGNSEGSVTRVRRWETEKTWEC